ncbi:MAG TPA: hypothetical protein VK737_10215 [Opitutales bacterium]|jgi:hypothetical protein|nr:hypothetical protein [Opitutales bacterium]
MKITDKIPTLARIGRFILNGPRKLGCYLGKRLVGIFHFFWKRKWKIAFAAACLVTLIALVLTALNYHYQAAWNNYAKEARARSEILTVDELAPTPVPDDQNFAMTPLSQEIFYAQSKSVPSKTRPNFYISDDVLTAMPAMVDGFGIKEVNAQIALQHWKEFFQKTDVLDELKEKEIYMAQMDKDLLRPYSRFPIDYSKRPAASILIPQIGPLLNISTLFYIRGFAEFTTEKYDDALATTLTLLRLSQTVRDEPFLISKLTEISMLGRPLQMIWDGLATHCWTDGQLAALEAEIQKVDMMPQFLQSLKGEKTYMNDSLLSLAQQNWWERMQEYNRQFKMMTNGYPNLYFDIAILLSSPRFGIYRALVIGNPGYESLFRAINVNDHRIDPIQVKAVDSAINNLDKNIPGNGFLIDLLPTAGSCVAIFAHSQTWLDQAAVACALERYRLAQGTYPEKLNDLVPKYIKKLPNDIITGGPLHYQRTPDGLFVLYSIGWDGIDHGGEERISSDGETQKDYNWVWKYPAQ